MRSQYCTTDGLLKPIYVGSGSEPSCGRDKRGRISGFIKDERRSRDIFRPVAWWLTILGTVGTLFHVRGITRQMGGFHNWKYNVVAGPPFLAPMQMALFGLLGVAASDRLSDNLPESDHSDED